MPKAINSLLLYVTNPHTSAEFYRKLGLEIVQEDDKVCLAKLGDFTLQCFDKTKLTFSGDSNVEPKGAGVFIYLQADNIDDYYKSLVDKGLKPSSEPKDWEWGNREFVIRDPDGYKITVYQPK